jgi:ABC-2 type transport system permease protein
MSTASTAPRTTSTPTTHAAATDQARPGTVAREVLRTSRRSIGLWALAVAGVSVLYTAFYPSIGGAKMEVMMESMPPGLIEAMGLQDMASAAGYVSSTVFSLLGAILTLVCAISVGARLVAGAEEDWVLELEMTGPVSRARVYTERLAVLWLTVLALTTSIVVVLLALTSALDMDVTLGGLLAAGLSLWVFGGAMGTLAFAVGAATGRRGPATTVAATVAALGYVLAYLAPMVDGGAWLARLSPYEWYIGNDPLVHGVDAAGLGLLLGLAVLALVGGLVPFRRRDLTV